MNSHHEDANVLVKRRLEELEELKEKGVVPYAYEYEVTAHTQTIKDNFDDYLDKVVRVAGRIMAERSKGKVTFLNIQDKEGKIQIFVKIDNVGEDVYGNLKLLDIGDFIGVEGEVFKTKTGEISVRAKGIEVLSKSIRPIPIVKESVDEDGNKVVHDQFSDKELRYRQRYLDLILNPDVKEVFVQRTKIVTAMREFLDSNGYLEVQTPILQPLYGGASARPFVTHHNALDMDLYLRIADELYLKRLIVGGFEGVYEIGKDFRNEGIDKTHNPEFTMMELYVSYKDYNWMMNFVEELFRTIAKKVFGTTKFNIEGQEIDFEPKWQRISMCDELKRITGIDVLSEPAEVIKEALKSRGVELKGGESKGKLIDALFEITIQPSLIQPSFITDYPVELSPLAKKHRSKEGLVERFEGFVMGREICNAFSELNDPIDQLNRFKDQNQMREEGDDEAHQIDEDYVKALEYGMPPTAGLGVGVDRMVMLFTNQPSIRDVILFPHMRPDK